MLVKGKGAQKYQWVLFNSIWKTAHFDANYMKIGSFNTTLRFYVFKMAANGGRHFEIKIKTEKCSTHIIYQKYAYTFTIYKCDLCKQ